MTRIGTWVTSTTLTIFTYILYLHQDLLILIFLTISKLCWVVEWQIFCTGKKGMKREAAQLACFSNSIHLSPNVTVRHLSIFFKARKCPSFHTVLGSLKIDPKKVINLLLPLNLWFLVECYYQGYRLTRFEMMAIGYSK